MKIAPEPREFDDSIWTGSKQRNWLFFGLIVSLLLHAGLCAWFYRAEFHVFDAVAKAPEKTHTFKVKNVALQPLEQPSMDQSAEAAKPEPDQTEEQRPDEKKSFDKLLEEVHASTAVPDDTRDVLPETPKVEPTDASSILNEIERSTAQVLTQNPNATREQTMLNDTAISGRPQPALTGTELATSTTIKRPNVFNKLPDDSAGPNRGRAPGFSDLDSLLSQKGPLGSGTAIRLPSDPLYEYDSADLQPGAISELQKLATLIKRNPNAKFTIEGYSDSFGSPEYNLDLSQRRADSVARYLVEALGVNPAQIRTRGFGTAKLIVQPRAIDPNNPVAVDMEIARQRPNRRVVIVVDTKG
ncbi:MAG TPA: OmpA family protein [Chthoniobacterales bacterium]|nr:OmpA family protein [Chthoniobacterales bacterium]